jgi:Cof subfamily protein (haloacid dehalogenase superfamily)
MDQSTSGDLKQHRLRALLAAEKYDLVAIDVDGTLLDSSHRLSRGVVEGISAIRNRNLLPVLVTGRSTLSILSYFDLLQISPYYVGAGGAYVAEIDGDLIMEASVERRDAECIVHLVRERGLGVFFHEPMELLCEIDRETLESLKDIAGDSIKQVKDVLTQGRRRPSKLTVFGERAALEALNQRIHSLDLWVTTTYSGPRFLEVTRAGVSKGSGLRYLARHLRIPLERVLVIGDQENDLSMFEVAGAAVAMGNAPEIVKAAADLVAPTNDEGGLAWVLHRVAGTMVAERRIALIAVDVDGTLLTPDNRVTEASIAAAQQACDQGLAIVLISGRPPFGVLPAARRLGLSGVLIAYNGAYIIDCVNDEVLLNRTLSAENARRAVKIIRQHGLYTGYYAGMNWLVEKVCDEMRFEQNALGCAPKVVSDLITEAPSRPNKLIVIEKEVGERLERGYRALRAALPDVNIHYSSPDSFEVVDGNTSKADALAFLARRMGIEPEMVMAIGDSHNDLSMLSFAGLAVAMGNAPPEVKEAADWVVMSNTEDGVAEAIQRLLQARSPEET